MKIWQMHRVDCRWTERSQRCIWILALRRVPPEEAQAQKKLSLFEQNS